MNIYLVKRYDDNSGYRVLVVTAESDADVRQVCPLTETQTPCRKCPHRNCGWTHKKELLGVELIGVSPLTTSTVLYKGA